jgi:hypothetical protein
MAETLSHIHHIGERIRDSSWFFRPFGWLLILALSGEFAAGFLGHSGGWDEAAIDRAVIVGGFFILLISAVVREIVGLRRSRYATVTDKFEAVHASLKELNTYLTQIALADPNIEQFEKSVRGELEYLLDCVAEIFGIISGTTCRTAIKVIHVRSDKIYVYTLTRDKRSNRTNRSRDQERFDHLRDSLEANEDFHSIFTETARYFFEGDLTRRINYLNSSFPSAGGQWRGTNWLHRTLFPGWGWPLPYRSTMVFPIQQTESETFAFDPPGCIGFLAIDGRFRHQFRARFDAPLGMSVADALFSPLYRYVTLLKSKE